MEDKSVAFFYPSHVLGGAELLFIRLAKYLGQDFQTAIIDYPDGFLTKSTSTNDEIKKIAFSMAGCEVKGFDYIVAPASHMYILQRYLAPSENTKILLWFLQPYNLVHQFPLAGLLSKLEPAQIHLLMRTVFFEQYRVMRIALDWLSQSRGLVFMDIGHVETNEFFFDLQFEQPPLLPIPVESPEIRKRSAPPSSNAFNIGWLGRLTDFKVHSLNYVIRKAEEFAKISRRQVTIHIIGEGEYANKVIHPQDIAIRYLGTLAGNVLDQYLSHNIDVVFAMGTSALEAAKLAIPVALVDMSYGPFPEGYKFKWLFETKGNTLGRVVGKRLAQEYRYGHEFQDLVREIEQNPIGERCYQYFERFHTLEAVAHKLILSLDECRVTYGGLQNKLKPSVLYEIWHGVKHRLKRSL